jgi:hypothetical protein
MNTSSVLNIAEIDGIEGKEPGILMYIKFTGSP